MLLFIFTFLSSENTVPFQHYRRNRYYVAISLGYLSAFISRKICLIHFNKIFALKKSNLASEIRIANTACNKIPSVAAIFENGNYTTIFFVLFVLILYAPVNNFSVTRGHFPFFLG